MFFMGFVAVWVAGQISADVQAALGMVNQCSILLMVVAMAVSSGATAAVSQSLGALKVMRAQRYIGTTVIGCMGLGLLVALTAALFSDGILRVLMVPESIMPQTREMWAASMLGLPAQYLYASTGVMFRATRQVLPPLWVASGVCLCNLLACLGLGLGWFGLPNMHGSTGDIVLLGTQTPQLEEIFHELTHKMNVDLGGSGSNLRTPEACLGQSRCEYACYNTQDMRGRIHAPRVITGLALRECFPQSVQKGQTCMWVCSVSLSPSVCYAGGRMSIAFFLSDAEKQFLSHQARMSHQGIS